MPRDTILRILTENAHLLSAPDPRTGAVQIMELLEKELGPAPVARSAETAPQQVDVLTRQVEDLKADKATLSSQLDEARLEIGRYAKEVEDKDIELNQEHEKFIALEAQVATLTLERDNAREAGQTALEQLKGLKSAAATAATETLSAVVPVSETDAPAP